MIYSYNLDVSKPSLGIGRENFLTPFCASINAESIYKGKPLYEQFIYNEQCDSYFLENEYFSIYEPYIPVPKSPLYLNLNFKLFLSNERVTFFLTSFQELNTNQFDIKDASICFEIFIKKTGCSYQGALITSKNHIKAIQSIQQLYDRGENCFPWTIDFYGILVNEITMDNILSSLNKIARQERTLKKHLKFNKRHY